MRDIRFRAWDKHENLMYEWNYIDQSDKDGVFMFMEMLKDDNFILMQFTGLKDKNGVEIWEGDVIELSANAYHDLQLKFKLANKGHRAKVIFSEGCFEWYVGNFHYALNELIPKTCDEEIKHMFLDALNCDHKGLTCEVIGNIHQHPNLLKEVA